MSMSALEVVGAVRTDLQLLALLFYDYVLTFPAEVRCIWNRKITGASLLFFVNRYCFLVFKVLLTIQMSTLITKQSPAMDKVRMRYLTA